MTSGRDIVYDVGKLLVYRYINIIYTANQPSG